MPDAVPSPWFEDELDRLLDRVLSAPEAEWSGALNRVCREHPERARGLRQRFRYLQRLGVAPDDAPAVALRSGSQFGDYGLDELLGAGAMGVVFRAVDRRTDETVALKVLRPELIESAAAERRFRHEAEVLARHRHAALCRVHEIGAVDGTPFLAMELLAGETLTDRLARARRHVAAGAPDWRAATRWVAEIARGLARLHAEGVVHRDVKPANVMLRECGAPVLFDFGLAWSDAAASLTRTGSALGTPAYMPPEQVRGDARVTPRADVWSLGATLYECLALRPPFEAVHRENLYRRILGDEPTPVRRHNPEVPRTLALVVHRCLEKDRARRYADAGALADDLECATRGQRVTARAPGPLRRAVVLARRHPIAATSVGAVLLLLALLARLVSVEREAADIAARLEVSAMNELSGGDPAFGALLARDAFDRARNFATRTRLVAALLRMHQTDEVRTGDIAWWAAPSPNDEGTLLCGVWGPSESLTSTAGTWRRVLRGSGRFAAWSPDGTRFVAGNPGQWPRLYSAASDEQLDLPTKLPEEGAVGDDAAQQTQAGMRTRPVFDPAGRLFWGDASGRIHAVSASGTMLWSAPAHDDGAQVLALYVLAEADKLLSVATDGSVVVTNATSGSRLLARAAVRPDAMREDATGVIQKQLRRDAAVVMLSRGVGATQVLRSALSRDGRRLALGLLDRSIEVLDTESLESIAEPKQLAHTITCLAMDDKGTRLLVGSLDRRVRLWATNQARPEWSHLGESNPESCAFAPDDGSLVAAFHQGPIHVLGLNGEVRSVLRGHSGTPSHIAFSASGQELLSAGHDTVRRWKTMVPGFPVLRPAQRYVWCAAWIDERYVVCAAAPNTLSLWDTETGAIVGEVPLPELRGGAGGALRIAVSPQRLPDGSVRLATCGALSPMRHFRCRPGDPEPFAELPVLDGAGRRAYAIGFSPSGELIVPYYTGGVTCYAADGRVLWNVPLTTGGAAVATGPNGVSFLAEKHGIRRLAAGSHRQLHTEDPVEYLLGVDVDPLDPQRLLAAGVGGSFWLLRTDGTIERQEAAHESRIECVAFSPDGRRFVTAGADGRARVFTREGRPFIDLPHGGIVTWAAFSPDGKRVLTAGSDRAVRIWPIDDDELEALAEVLCFRDFTPYERRRVETLLRR